MRRGIMAGYKIPVFAKGMVLTDEMLESLKAYLTDWSGLEYEGYSDGILSGCRVTTSGNMLNVGKGIVIYKKRLYLLSEETTLLAKPHDEWQRVILRMGSVCRTGGFEFGELWIEITSETDGLINCLEICRFRLQPGAVLRDQYTGFADMDTEYDTINELYAQWAGYGEATVSQRILHQFAMQMTEGVMTNPLDTMFVMQIMNCGNQSLPRTVINTYLSARLQTAYQNRTNREVYEGLAAIVRRDRTGMIHNRDRTQEREKRLLVD